MHPNSAYPYLLQPRIHPCAGYAGTNLPMLGVCVSPLSDVLFLPASPSPLPPHPPLAIPYRTTTIPQRLRLDNARTMVTATSMKKSKLIIEAAFADLKAAPNPWKARITLNILVATLSAALKNATPRRHALGLRCCSVKRSARYILVICKEFHKVALEDVSRGASIS